MNNILNEPVEIRLAKAKNPKTDQDTLSILSTDTFWFVRDFVACNPNTPQETLLCLLTDPDFRIRYDANKNLNKENLDQQIAFASLKKQHSSPKIPHLLDPYHDIHTITSEKNNEQER